MQKNIHGNQDIFEWEEVPVKCTFPLIQLRRGVAQTFAASSSIAHSQLFCSSSAFACLMSVHIQLCQRI